MISFFFGAQYHNPSLQMFLIVLWIFAQASFRYLISNNIIIILRCRGGILMSNSVDVVKFLEAPSLIFL